MKLSSALFLVLASSNPAFAQDPNPAPEQQQAKTPTRDQARALLDAGDLEAAEKAWSALRSSDPKDGEATFLLAYVLHAGGKLQQAHDMHIEAATFPEFAALAHYNHACVHSLWNQPDPAFAALDSAIASGFDDTVQLESDTDMASLRSDARYAAIINQLSDPKPAATAEPTPTPALYRLAELPNAQRMDFFAGTWDVRDTQDQSTTSAQTTKVFNGTALRATISNTASGETRNEATYFPDGDGWRMIWMDHVGERAILEGALVKDKLIFNLVSMNGEPQTGSRAVFSGLTAQYFTYAWEVQDADGGWSALNTWRYLRSSRAQ